MQLLKIVLILSSFLCIGQVYAQEGSVRTTEPEPINTERPGFTNGIDTVGLKIFQFEGGITRRMGKNSFLDGGIVRYGVQKQTEIRLGVPSYVQKDGWTPASFGFKTTVTPHIALVGTRTNERRPFRQMAVETQFTLTKVWSLQADIVRDSAWSSGLNLGYSASDRVAYFAEFYKQNGPHGDAGVTYQLTLNQQVDFSAGDGFASIGYALRWH